MTRIININQLLPVVEPKAEFVIIDKDYYIVIDYVYQGNDTFDDPRLLECRGIKFDKAGLIIGRPFRKFFNYGERGAKLPMHRPHIITEKLDGSMVHPVLLGRDLVFMTRKGHTDVAKKAERFIMSHPKHRYLDFCMNAIKEGWTPIFEYVGPDNRIVLRYNEPSLVLLAMRHIIDGHIMPRARMEIRAEGYSVPCVGPLPITGYDFKDTASFVEHTRQLEDAEGYVVYFDDGYMVKVKAEDYVLKHRALDDMSSKRKIVALCCQGFADDVLPILSEPDAEELVDFNSRLHAEIDTLVKVAEDMAALVKNNTTTRKKFALEWVPTIRPKWLAGVCFGIMDGKNARQFVLQAVERGGYEDLNIKWRGE